LPIEIMEQHLNKGCNNNFFAFFMKHGEKIIKVKYAKGAANTKLSNLSNIPPMFQVI